MKGRNKTSLLLKPYLLDYLYQIDGCQSIFCYTGITKSYIVSPV
jgi:hypothetical protein